MFENNKHFTAVDGNYGGIGVPNLWSKQFFFHIQTINCFKYTFIFQFDKSFIM